MHRHEDRDTLVINRTLDTVLTSLQEVGQFIVWLALGVAPPEIVLCFLLCRLSPTMNTLVYMLLAPALIGIAFQIIYPFAFEVYLAFTHVSLKTARNPTFSLQNGLDNLCAVFRSTPAYKADFWQVLRRTVLWTIMDVVFHISGGMVLALLLNRPIMTLELDSGENTLWLSLRPSLVTQDVREPQYAATFLAIMEIRQCSALNAYQHATIIDGGYSDNAFFC